MAARRGVICSRVMVRDDSSYVRMKVGEDSATRPSSRSSVVQALVVNVERAIFASSALGRGDALSSAHGTASERPASIVLPLVTHLTFNRRHAIR